MGIKDEQIKSTKSSRKVGVGKAPRFNDNQFVRYELDKAQQSECKAWDIGEDGLLDLVSAAIDDGYRFSLKWDDYSECYGVFMQPVVPEGSNAGLILTGRGSTVGKSIKQVLYKHHTCLAGDWSEYAERRGRDVIDD